MAPSMPHASPLTLQATRRGRCALFFSCVVLLFACLLYPASCSFPGSVAPTVKIGLSAPFEGLYRDLGYEALYAVRLAVRQRNESGGVGERYLVELVALNDFGEAEEAVLQAREMAADPGVLGALGGWSPATAQVALPEYSRLGLPFLTPQATLIDARQEQRAEPGWLESYEALSAGVAPGPTAVWAYWAANCLMDAVDAAARAGGQPTRARVQAEAGACQP